MEPQETTQKETASSSNITTIAAALVTSAAMIAIALVIILHPSGKTGTAPADTAAGTSTAPAEVATVPASVATVRTGDAPYIRGDAATAQVLVIEYSDSDCPFCVRFHPTLQQIIKDYQGKVAWVYRFFPLESLHPNAYNEALALQCAGQIGGAKAFNGYLDSVINVTVNPDPKSNEILTTLAAQQGIDAKAFNACIAAPATATAVRAGIDEAEKIGARGTPFSIIVNKTTGKQVIIPGAYPIGDVKKAIDSVM